MKVEVTASVVYVCNLKEKDAEMVRDYAEHENCSLRDAVADLYADGVIDLYYDSTEADLCTESIDDAEE